MNILLHDDINFLNKLKKDVNVYQDMAYEILNLFIEVVSSSEKSCGTIPRNNLTKYKYFGNISPLLLGLASYNISKSNILILLDYSDNEENLSNFPINYCEKMINQILKPYRISVHYSAKQTKSHFVNRTLTITYNRTKKNYKRLVNKLIKL